MSVSKNRLDQLRFLSFSATTISHTLYLLPVAKNRIELGRFLGTCLCSNHRHLEEDTCTPPETVLDSMGANEELAVDGSSNRDPEEEEVSTQVLGQCDVAEEECSLKATSWKEGMVENPSIGGGVSGKDPTGVGGGH